MSKILKSRSYGSPQYRFPSPGTGAIVRSVEVAEPDLEAVFLHLTGRALRD